MIVSDKIEKINIWEWSICGGSRLEVCFCIRMVPQVMLCLWDLGMMWLYTAYMLMSAHVSLMRQEWVLRVVKNDIKQSRGKHRYYIHQQRLNYLLSEHLSPSIRQPIVTTFRLRMSPVRTFTTSDFYFWRLSRHVSDVCVYMHVWHCAMSLCQCKCKFVPVCMRAIVCAHKCVPVCACYCLCAQMCTCVCLWVCAHTCVPGCLRPIVCAHKYVYMYSSFPKRDKRHSKKWVSNVNVKFRDRVLGQSSS